MDSSIWFENVGNELSRHYYDYYYLNQVRRPTRTDVMSNFFSNRVVEPWI